jgi:aminopeptidase N
MSYHSNLNIRIENGLPCSALFVICTENSLANRIKRILRLLPLLLFFSCATAPPEKIQTGNKKSAVPEKINYRAAYTQSYKLLHTRLNLKPDWAKRELSGEARLLLRPYFYPADRLTLNARGMEIREVALVGKEGKHLPLTFEYDSLLLKIKLDRIYAASESLDIFVRYRSRPEQLPRGGSAAIRSDKGLYFINADSLDPELPTQLWTQGETESNSVWFPTLEDPQQRMTQEIYLTVDTAFTTLSNGLLISSVNNNDGTKTDYWKQSLPTAPYLTMIAAGNFAVVKDRWRNLEVSYYVDPPYEKYASLIFGLTPGMMTFFSEKLGVTYPWEKYAQVVVHNYISGAMENTTAVVHGTNMQQDPRDYLDGNYEDYISHELFHHWFGNLVTCESWSNITLNEGFANYSEYLWREFKYGRDDADRLNQNDQSGYLYVSTQGDPPLFRTAYDNREDVYDAISYNKGGRVLHMLRKYTGDSAFFVSLHNYLEQHRFSSVEIADLRLAFERTTGEDLNWFFDQWFLKGGHPVLNIDYAWNDSLRRETVTIRQRQDFARNPLYRLPLDVDLYYEGKTERRRIVADDVEDTFSFDLPSKPDLVNVDAEKMLLCNKSDNKSNEALIFQFHHAPLFLDRYEAVSRLGSNYKSHTPEANLIIEALNDKYYSIRLTALNYIGELAMNHPDTLKDKIRSLVVSDTSPDVREKALWVAGKYFSYKEFAGLIDSSLNDNSYKVVAQAFKIISEKDPGKAGAKAAVLERDSGQAILSRLAEYYNNSQDDKIDFYKRALRLSSHYTRYNVMKDFEKYLKSNGRLPVLQEGTTILLQRAKQLPPGNYRSMLVNSLYEIESSVKKKISVLEGDLLTPGDSPERIEKEAELLDWKNFKDGLHGKITAIEN